MLDIGSSNDSFYYLDGNNLGAEVGDIVSVKGEEWGMYVINVEGDNVSCVELDLILECKLEDIEE